ncbi:MAG: acyltransferase [Treponema sp.]|jgi:hypothetical protein|nr:acyltransferase [Treponema sp.]
MDIMANVSRKHFIDNVRSVTTVTVIVYHVVYLFNSVGVLKNIEGTGIPLFDGFCYAVYPWFMAVMFMLAGISTRYALQKRTGKQFLKERRQKLLVPLFGGMLLLGWINAWVTLQYFPISPEHYGFGVMAYFVFLSIGPLWFMLELFMISIVLLLIRKIDKNDRLGDLAGRANIFVLLLLVVPFWGSSCLLNTPVLIKFRNGIYLFTFLTGYYLFSKEKIIAILVKFRLPLLAAGVILGIVEICYFYGQDYSSAHYLEHPLTNLYAWIMMLAILGCSKKYFDGTNKFMKYLNSRSFLWYVSHFPIMLFTAYILMSKFKFPMICNYMLLLLFSFGTTILFCEITRLVPILRYLLFGIRGRPETPQGRA